DGIARASRAAGYDILLVTGEEAFRGVERLTRSKQVDGFLLLAVVAPDPRGAALRRSGQPGGLIGLPTDGADLHRVDLDWTAAGAMLVDQLAVTGHTHVCVLGAPSIAHEMRMTYAERFQHGVREAAERAGVHVLELPAGSAEATFRGVSAVLADHPETTAFIVQHEPAVAPLVAAVTAAGRSVPGDLSVTGVTVDALDPGLVTAISGVENPSRLVTRTAVDLLVETLGGARREPVTTLLPPTYVHRGTAGQAPA
ncbi:substrate-binding domain-containing protein, partial [Georgenia sp.]